MSITETLIERAATASSSLGIETNLVGLPLPNHSGSSLSGLLVSGMALAHINLGLYLKNDVDSNQSLYQILMA